MEEEATLFATINRKCITAKGVILRLKGVIASLIVSIPTGYALFFVLSHTGELSGEYWVAFSPAPWSIMIGLFGWFYPNSFITFVKLFWKVILIFQILGFFS